MSIFGERILSTLIDIDTLYGFISVPSEKKIEKNLSQLKDFQWFEEISQHNQYQKLIDTNPRVRCTIGEINIKRAKKYPETQLKYKEMIMKVLREESLGK